MKKITYHATRLRFPAKAKAKALNTKAKVLGFKTKAQWRSKALRGPGSTIS